MIVVGLQLIFVLKELRKTIKKIGDFTDELNEMDSKKEISHQKKQLINKKHSSLHSILDKINILSPHLTSKTKKFFIKEKS